MLGYSRRDRKLMYSKGIKIAMGPFLTLRRRIGSQDSTIHLTVWHMQPTIPVLILLPLHLGLQSCSARIPQPLSLLGHVHHGGHIKHNKTQHVSGGMTKRHRKS